MTLFYDLFEEGKKSSRCRYMKVNEVQFKKMFEHNKMSTFNLWLPIQNKNSDFELNSVNSSVPFCQCSSAVKLDWNLSPGRRA